LEDEGDPAKSKKIGASNEWKKAKLKTEDLLALVNRGFLHEKEMDLLSHLVLEKQIKCIPICMP
jgi:hypothetical protein